MKKNFFLPPQGGLSASFHFYFCLCIHLYGHTNGIAVNKLYVRVRPSGTDQLELLENLNIPLFDYPLDL